MVEQAYAKLHGEDTDGTAILKYVKHLPLRLGRNVDSKEGDPPRLGLGEYGTLSRWE